MDFLVLAMTKMLSGICTAGFTADPDPVTGLRWVRPVKEAGTLLLGDMTTADKQVLTAWDVVDLGLLKPRPDPPHVEDWLCDFIFHRPRKLRRLEGDRRAAFLADHLDKAPEEVLVHQRRTLCLIHPDQLTAHFSLDPLSGKYQVRIDFTHGDQNYSMLPVTDMKWRALGRGWLGDGGELSLPLETLQERLEIETVYLALGLSRGYQGKLWPLAIGVHTVPDFEAIIDYENP